MLAHRYEGKNVFIIQDVANNQPIYVGDKMHRFFH